MSDVKLCKDCRWFDGPSGLRTITSAPACTHPKIAPPNLTYGGVLSVACVYARAAKACGKAGKYWEPAPARPAPWWAWWRRT